MGLFTREVNDIREGLAAELGHKYRVPVLLGGLLILGLAISWTSTLFLASLGGLTWLIVRHLNRSAELVSVLATREAALQLCLLQEDFGLIRTVRVHGVENYDKLRFDEHLERHRDAEVRRVLNEARTSPTATLLIFAAATLAVGLLSEQVIMKGYSAASALLLIIALLSMIKPSMDWLKMKRAIRLASRSAEGVLGYLERRAELHQAGGAVFLPPLREKISFENVTLENGSGRVLLDGLTVEILARSKTSIMSLDDEAKTALVCLIPRLIDPKVGRVRVDGVDLRDVTLESVRAQVATVLQADLVFSDTVVANIALGDASYDLPRVIEAAKVAHAHHFIQDLPHGYDTVIGPLGEYLKPDQQYRIALARAFLHDPSIVIIEEPNVPMDDDTKAFVDDTVARLAPGRTLIMLPHRLSTIRSSDRVILLHNGRLEAVGSPSEVKGESKLYRHLQYVEFNQFAAGEIEAGQMGAERAESLRSEISDLRFPTRNPAKPRLSCPVVDRRLDDQLGNVSPGWELDEEADCGGDILGLEDRVLPLLRDGHRPGVEDRGVDLARVNDGGADAPRPLLPADPDPERALAELRGGVARASQEAGAEARDRADLDDQAAASLAHRRQEGVDQVERAGQVRVDHQVPVGRRELGQAPVADVRPGVADQHVDLTAEGRQDPPGHRVDPRAIGHVERLDQRVLAADERFRRFQLRGVAADQGDADSDLRQADGRGAADPAPGAGDQGIQ